MKTNLTLIKSAFYFLKSINLIKGISQPVDLSLLSPSELKGLKTQVAYGFIEAEDDISDYKSELEEEVALDVTPESPEIVHPAVEDHNPDLGNTTVEGYEEPKEVDAVVEDETTTEYVEDEETQSETQSESSENPSDPYDGWLKNKVKKELNNRNIEYSNDMLKDDLVLLLYEDDEKTNS